MQLN
jgi:hypothetical protein